MADFFDTSDNSPDVVWPIKDTGTTQPSGSDQWLRKISLTIFDSTSAKGEMLNFTPSSANGQQAPDLRVTFQVQKATNQSPNLLHARVYNLHPKTMEKAITFKAVELDAGYQTGRFGPIFKGTIVQFRRGKETPVDTYLELIAGDGDAAYNYDTHTGQWDKGTQKQKVIQDIAGSLKGRNQEVSVGQIDAGDYGKQVLLKSYSAHGMVNTLLRTHVAAAGGDWWIDDGKVCVIPRTSYKAGEAAVLSPTTGLIGMPEVTPQGIQARCLLNPDLVLGGLVKIETDRLSGVTFIPGSQSGSPASETEAPSGVIQSTALFGQQITFAFTSPVGTYKILLLEHSGDTRGNAWYSDMVCVALDSAGDFLRSVDLPYKRTKVTGLESSNPTSLNPPT